MLNTRTTTVLTLSRLPMAPLIFADTYSLGSTNNTPFLSISNFNATANQRQTLYQPHTAPNVGPSAILPSSSSTVNPINP